MAIVQPPDATRFRVTGVALMLVPGRHPATGKPWTGNSEVRRAPDLNGVADDANAVTIADDLPALPAGGAYFVDVRSSGRWYYSWRHKGPGYTPGAWSAWVGAEADIVPAAVLAGAINGGSGAGVFPIVRAAQIRDQNLGNKGAVTTTVDWSDEGGTTRRVRLTASGGTILFKNGRPGQRYTLIVQQDGTGGRTVASWDPAIAWSAGGGAPTLTTTADRADLLTFDCSSTGGNIRYTGQLDKANVIHNDVKVAIRDVQVLSSMTAGTTIAITDMGFAPKLILVLGSGRNDAIDANGRANYHYNFGAATGPSVRRTQANFADDASTPGDVSRIGADLAVALEIDGAGVTGALDVSSFDADGVTLIVDNQYVTSRRYTVVLVGGDTFTASIGQFTTPTATGNQSVTGVGFQPTGLILFGGNIGTANLNTCVPQGMIGLGFASSTSARYAMTNAQRDNETTQKPVSYGFTGECYADGELAGPPDVDASRFRADLISFDSGGGGGFTINWLETALGRQVFYIAVAGCRCVVTNLATQTDTTTDIVVSGLAVLAKLGILMSHNRATSTQNTSDQDAQLSLGVFAENPLGGTPVQRAISTMEQYNASAAAVVSGTGVAYAAVYQNLAVADGSLEGRMVVRSIDPTGFTARMDDADPSAARVGCFILGA